VRQIARRLGRDPSTISRELRRNAATRGGRLDYRASVAHLKAELMARRPKTAKLVAKNGSASTWWKTPAEALNDQLLLLQATGVASTS
jgi:Helix-turn-helix domain